LTYRLHRQVSRPNGSGFGGDIVGQTAWILWVAFILALGIVTDLAEQAALRIDQRPLQEEGEYDPVKDG
jgi:hypothetical protein